VCFLVLYKKFAVFTSQFSSASKNRFYNLPLLLYTIEFPIQLNQEKENIVMVEFTVFKGSKQGKIIKSTTRKELKPDEILIKVTHSGVCGTDEHFKHTDMALGHEGAGVVEARSLQLMRLLKLIITRKSVHQSRIFDRAIQ
jgi:hypothetical protein